MLRKMKNIILASLLIVNGIASASDLESPSFLMCVGSSIPYNPDSYSTLRLDLDNTSGNPVLRKRSTLIESGKATKGTLSTYQVQYLGPKEAEYILKGNLENSDESGYLNFDISTGKGTWKETGLNGVGSGSGEIAAVHKDFRVTCQLVQ